MAWRLIATEEVARAGSGGLLASLFSHSIGLPPVIAHGSDALQRRIVPDVLAGRKIAALAITEPGAGSDVARLACRARRDGADWVIDGEKAFITSGLRADWLTVAVRTGGPGARGISLLAVPGDAAGLERSPLAKMGWWCSDTARLAFTECRVPAENLIGAENEGFLAIMDNFNGERLLMATSACAFAAVDLRLRGSARAAAAASGTLVAPMHGRVTEACVEAGATVAAGALLVVIEAMKMEHQIRAPHAGTIAALHVRAGDQVAVRQPLVEVRE